MQGIDGSAVSAEEGVLGEQLVDRCQRALGRLPAGSRVGGATALALRGIPVPAEALTRLSFVVARGAYRSPRETFDLLERVGVEGDEVFAGLPVIGVAAAWVDSMTVLGEEDAIVAGDAAAQVLGGTKDLWRELAGRPRGRAVHPARMALGQVRYGSRSPGETRLRLVARRHRLPEPVLGGELAPGLTCALAWPVSRLALLVDGGAAATRGVRAGPQAAGWRVRTVPEPGLALPGLGAMLRDAFLGRG